MPEGDSLRRLATRIQERFGGRRVERCVTRDPRLVGVDLTGTTLVGAEAVGKHLLVRFSDQRTLHAHLRMDGRFVVGPAATGPDWHRRVELWFQNGRLTGLDVAILGILPTAAEATVVGHVGPDLCGREEPDLDEIVERLVADEDRPLAGALLDQRNVGGFGNVFAIELPFLVGLSPFRPVATIDGLRETVAVGAALIRDSTRRGVRNTTGRRLHTSQHWIYGRRGRPCPLCGTRLAGDERPPWQRVTVWCPTCQPAEAATADLTRARRLLALHPAVRSFGSGAPGAAARDRG